MKFDALVIGGGHSGMAKAVELRKEGKKCALISKGRSIYGFNPEEFEALGGSLLMGDEIVKVNWNDGKVASVNTANLGEVEIEAEAYYLATGKFFAGGLVADMDEVREPIFGLDVEYDKNRDNWFSKSFADHQPFMDFGVRLSEDGCAMKDGLAVKNVFPIGEIIAK